MGQMGANPDEVTYGLLMDTCFKENRPDDAAGYFKKMVDSYLRPNLAVNNRLADGLVKVGKIDEAKSFFDTLLDDNGVDFDEEFQEFVKVELRKEGREDELAKLMEEKERLKAEAKAKEAEAEAAEASKISARREFQAIKEESAKSEYAEKITEDMGSNVGRD